MTWLRYLVFLGVLVCAPAMAQVRAVRHSAGESCSAPAATAPSADPPALAEQAKPAPAEPPTSSSGSCEHCDHRYRMPPRWHSFLPGMYR